VLQQQSLCPPPQVSMQPAFRSPVRTDENTEEQKVRWQALGEPI